MTSIRSSFRLSSMPGARSVRSWISTSLRRSLAALALLRSCPKIRSRMELISVASGANPARQPAEQAALFLQVEERHLLALQAQGDVAESLPRRAFSIHDDRHAAVGMGDDVLVFRDHPKQVDCQQLEHV